jgi:hypothetical protein
MRILGLCHDFNIVTKFRKGKEVALDPSSQSLFPEDQQLMFFSMIEHRMIHEVSRGNFENSDECTALFAPTNLGLNWLREFASEEQGKWFISSIHWNEYPDNVDLSDPTLLVQCFSGGVFASPEDSSSCDEKLVGEFTLLRINRIDLKVSGFDLRTVFESCAEAEPYNSLIQKPNKESLSAEEFGEEFCIDGHCWGSLILFDYLKIHSSFIGTGFGAPIIQKALSQAAPGGGVVAVTPFPLQFMGRGDIESDDNQYKQSFESLKKYYQRIGFNPHPKDTNLMTSDIEALRLRRYRKTDHLDL